MKFYVMNCCTKIDKSTCKKTKKVLQKSVGYRTGWKEKNKWQISQKPKAKFSATTL